MPRKLKVFQAQFGFWDCVVAAPSQAAALRAWGTRQNLFADGEARETTEDGAVAAATAHPETPLRRAVGSSDPFSLEPRLPQLPDGDAPPKPRGSAKAKPLLRPTPDRAPLTAAEAMLARVEKDRHREETAFAQRRVALDDEANAARLRYEAAHSQATTEVERCRQAFAKAGGRLKP